MRRKTMMLPGTLYALFLLWQNRWFSKPLSETEVDAYLAQIENGRPAGAGRAGRAAGFREFLCADDGKPFYMVNLMQYRETAVYPDDSHPDVHTGRDANARYSQAVIRELLKRGSYPVFLSRKLANMFSAGEGTDFFEEVGIVRYRSRRDLLEMACSPSFQAAEPHKWASMAKTVAVPTRKILLLDPAVFVPALLLLGMALGKLRKKKPN